MGWKSEWIYDKLWSHVLLPTAVASYARNAWARTIGLSFQPVRWLKVSGSTIGYKSYYYLTAERQSYAVTLG